MTSVDPHRQDFFAHGGSGVVVVRYKIASAPGVQKATGGAISFYNGKTIHTFTSSGTFATTSDWSPTNVEYVVVGGGGAGNGGPGPSSGAGGGAGGFITNTNHILSFSLVLFYHHLRQILVNKLCIFLRKVK